MTSQVVVKVEALDAEGEVKVEAKAQNISITLIRKVLINYHHLQSLRENLLRSPKKRENFLKLVSTDDFLFMKNAYYNIEQLEQLMCSILCLLH